MSGRASGQSEREVRRHYRERFAITITNRARSPFFRDSRQAAAASRSANSAFRSFFNILPLALRGSVSATKRIATGTLKAASRSRTQDRKSTRLNSSHYFESLFP